MACHISSKNSWQVLQLCFKPHLNQRSIHKVMGLQSCKSPNFGNFGIPTWEFQEKMTFGWHGKYYKGEGGGFPQSPGGGESCESMFSHGLSVHQRCSNYALTNLLFSLCRSVWVIDLLANLPNPHPGAPAHPSTPEMLHAMERVLIPSPFIVFIFGLVVESIKELRGAS